MGDLRQPNVAAAQEKPAVSPPFPPPSSNPSPFTVEAERLNRVEEATQKIICKVQPTCVSEKRRKEVIDYVQRLIRDRLGCEIFPFGSVPLKTYLPDGDIDLTAFCGATVEEALVNDVVLVLQAEEQNRAAEFIVKDVQLIKAEVKLVKCIVQNIVVDISFNQLGGLSTLCFLEQERKIENCLFRGIILCGLIHSENPVDRLIGKDHLFKRSIILIKAWCYYESRILGAHHGLISTYALETLVLYIFHLFHSTLNGPLTVLYRFLDYFSQFDWDNYCVSLSGRVPISLLPEIVAEKPENGGSDLLLSDEFLRNCADTFSVRSRGGDSNLRSFPSKHLNIIDPLKQNNNLGRSVSKGNFYRIRSAFTYGARKLGKILQQPNDATGGDLQKFFLNTLDRHGCEHRPDVQDLIATSNHTGLSPALSSSETFSRETEISGPSYTNLVHINGTSSMTDSNGSLDGDNDLVVSRSETQDGKIMNSPFLSETLGSVKKTTVMRCRTSGDAEDLATSRLEGLTTSEGTSNGFCSSPGEPIMPHSGISQNVPHLLFEGSSSGERAVECFKEQKNLGLTVDRVSSGCLQQMCGEGSDSAASVSNQLSCSTEDADQGYRETASLGGSSGHCGYDNFLSDLSGDYDSHYSSYCSGRRCYENSSQFLLPPQFPPQFQGNNSWDMMNHHNYYHRNGFSYVNANGAIRPAFVQMNPLVMPGAAAFSMDDGAKARGTGPYFPNMNRPSPQNKGFMGRERNHGAVRSPRDNGRAPMTGSDPNFLERSNRELPPPHNLPNGNLHPHHVNGFIPPPEGVVEFGTVGHAPSSVSIPDSITSSTVSQASGHSVSSPGTRKSKPAHLMNEERVMTKSSYLLKNDEDFPPLSM